MDREAAFSPHQSNGAVSWSPPTSRFQTHREAAATASRLSVQSGVLTWAPVGLKSRETGSEPFSVSIGPGVGNAQQLVWVYGDIAAARGGPVRANFLAVCSVDPSGPGGRRVLGYLPSRLITPYTGSADINGDLAAATEQTARTIAEATGLAFIKVEPKFGADLGKTFPGAMSHTLFIAASNYLNAALAVGFGAWFAALPAGLYGPIAIFGTVALSTAAAIMIAVGIALLPPVVRARKP